jgi:hypothetical protein
MPSKVEQISNEELAVRMVALAKQLENWSAPKGGEQRMPGLHDEYGRGQTEHAMEFAARAIFDAANTAYHMLALDAFDPTAFRRRG